MFSTMSLKLDNILNKLTGLLLLVSFCLYVPSYSINSWATSTAEPDTRAINISLGLWTTCYVRRFTLQESCVSTLSFIQDAWSDGWVAGTQAMTTLGLICLITAMTSMVTTFLALLERHPAPMFIALCATFSFVAFGWTGVIIFLCRWSYDDNLTNTELSWCTVLAIISLVFSMAALLSLFLRCMYLNSIPVKTMTAGRRSPWENQGSRNGTNPPVYDYPIPTSLFTASSLGNQ